MKLLRTMVWAGVFSGVAFGKGKSLHPHSHDEAELKIAVDDKSVTFDFEAAAVMIYGFEHEAKSASDKAKVTAAVKKFEENLAKIFILDAKQECKLASKSVTPFAKTDHDDDHDHDQSKKHAEHGEFKAEATFTCATAFTSASKITVAIGQFFPKAKNVDVELVSASATKKIEIKKPSQEVTLSP